MSHLVDKIRAHRFAGTSSDWQVYHNLVIDHLEPGMTVLDVGCGRGDIAPFPWEDIHGVTVIGLDPDPSAARNPNLDQFVLLDNEGRWPVEDNSLDLVIARYVLEHVASPADFFANVRRTLKPGGHFIFLTPNKRHPAMIVSRHLPHALKTRVLAHATGIDDADVFVTHYRLNTSNNLRRQAKRHGFFVEHLETKEFEPVRYLDFNIVGFLVAYGYYLAIKRTGLESSLGDSITGVFGLSKTAKG